MLEEKWAVYAKAWSQPDAERSGALSKIIADDVTYTDPTTEVSGADAFSSHIGKFQESLPGAYFEMTNVKGHHDKTLAQWRLCDKDGGEIMQGTSFATLNSNGKFTSFSGFF